MKKQHKATVNFMYFVYNFPCEFIDEVWEDNDRIKNHLIDKFDGHFIKANGNSVYCFLNWFMELDEDNKEKLLSWIDDNYLAHTFLKY